MSVLGADALGQWTLGHPSDVGAPVNLNLTGVAGTGVAGALTPNPSTALQGVAGIGVSGTFVPSVTISITGVAGIGTAGSLVKEVDNGPIGVSGLGIAGAIQPQAPGELTQAEGVGVVGLMFSSEQAFFQGVSGGGVAGQITTNPGGNFSGAYGTGIAGQITIVVSGGGTSRKLKTGLEPVKKRPRKVDLKPKVVLPPPLGIVAPPLAPAETSPIDDVEYAQRDLRSLEAAILDAEDITHMERLLRQLDEEDDRRAQDEADIADVLAMLELTD